MASEYSGSTDTVAGLTQLEFRLDETQSEFECRFFDAVLSRNGENVDVLRQLVELFAEQGNYSRALALDQRLVSLCPNDEFARYNLACTLCVLGHVVAGLKALEEAFVLGYDDVAHLEADADLDALRQHPGYFRLLRRFGLMV